jgi:hypothetical protein
VVLLYKEAFKVIGVKANHRETRHLTVLISPSVLIFGGWKTIMLYTQWRTTEVLL